VQSELQGEQAFVDMAYARLDAMRNDANSMLEGVLDLGRGGTFQSRTERDVIVRTSLARLEQLDIGDQALTFGRIDRIDGDQPGGTPDQAGGAGDQAGGASDQVGKRIETFHIGRLAIHSADHDPLVVDWRAPIAEPFYRATGRDPQNLVLRRHLALEGRRVVGLEDERFGLPGIGGVSDVTSGTGLRPAEIESGAESGADPWTQDGDTGGELIEGQLPIGGPAALLAALDRARSGRMTDIVATIQGEQDEIIRAPLAGVLVVQGGPGTGKTAVALHRAAYLLYTHRFPLERQGVLVVGPNPLFLRYIEQVLPSLGETGVTLSTVSGLVPEIRVTENGPSEVARLKGDPRMAKVIARAVRTRERALADDLAVPYGALLLRLSAEDSKRIVDSARRRPGTHNARRRLVEHEVARVLAERARQTQQTLGIGTGDLDDGTVTPFPGYEDPAELSGEEFDLDDFTRKVKRVPELAEALDRMWPRLSPHELLHDLFGAPALINAAGRDLLSPEERQLLYRPRSSSFDEVAWTPADAALVDEARHLLGPRSGSSSDDVARQYGHIVVDEVQDLSPMQLRMLTRRSLSGSMTVVGDIAQATAPWAPASWKEITDHLPRRRGSREVELTVSYRTPAEVLAVAGRVLAVAAPELTPPRPVRRTGVEPRMIAVRGADGSREEATTDDLARTVARVAGEEMAAVDPGRVAIIAPEPLMGGLADALAAEGRPVVDARDMRKGGLFEPLVLLAADGANGLEFDSVIVVEPALIAGETPRGLRTLYVALTRPTQRLSVVHLAPPPAPLERTG
jgi:DNA helicase IV